MRHAMNTAPMIESTGTPQNDAARRRSGAAFALSAAASAGFLLFLPVMMVGYTMSVAASVMRGEGLAWVSSVAMSFAFGGVLALLSVFLLLIPWALYRAARRRFGTRHATRWVGGLLVVWHAGTAAFWAWSATSSFTRAAVGEGLWYPAAFAFAAVAILIATVLVDRHAIGVAIAFAGLLAIAFAALLAIVVVGWGSGPTIPPGA